MKKNYFIRKYLSKVFWYVCLISVFSLIFTGANAEDLLSGTAESANQTFYGTGKYFLYLGEIVVGIILFIATRKYTVLTGIVVLSIFINSVLPHFLPPMS